MTLDQKDQQISQETKEKEALKVENLAISGYLSTYE